MLVQCNNSSGILLGCLQLGNFFFCLEEVRVWSSVIIFYGVVVWDPGLILAQIVYFQCLYYVTLSFFLAILIGTHVSRMILVYFFDLITIITSTFTGWCVIASFILTSISDTYFNLLNFDY
ncbi:hypothetical protein Ahy_B09g097332 isoform B [Arachis hypogaea]|uniref:Uncharacterized protein n=1 Tax=Arachis hypogaea TaxID=3818 RepID=A0A444XPH4_ARAHY|nr:hypothetical protein Ahy_B09g097332 isoform B [Arachis hypogaea]